MDVKAIQPLIVKVVVTLVVGGIGYLLTNVFGKQPETWRVMITVFVGGTAFIVQSMMDFERRLGGVESGLRLHTKQMEQVVDNGFTRINEATELFSLVEKSALRTDGVTQLVRNATELGTGRPEIVHAFVQELVNRLSILMKDLKSDLVEFEGEDHDWLLSLTRCAQSTIDATSTSVDANFWSTELGRRYLVEQRDAVGRKVQIRRLFIVSRPEVIDDHVLTLCRDQLGLGFEVRIVALSSLPGGMQLDTVNDFIVFDASASYEVTPDLTPLGGHPVITNTSLVIRPERVARRIRRFNDLWEQGKPVPPET
jgi:hypothetical protein